MELRNHDLVMLHCWSVPPKQWLGFYKNRFFLGFVDTELLRKMLALVDGYVYRKVVARTGAERRNEGGSGKFKFVKS